MAKVVTMNSVADLTGEEFEKAKDLVDATRNFDAYVYTSSVLKILATNLSKIATDFMSCMAYSLYGVDKLNIPLIQENPKKHFMNFETLDVVKQITFFVEGLDLTITKACSSTFLEMNIFCPVVLMSLFDQLSSLRRGVRSFKEELLDTIKF